MLEAFVPIGITILIATLLALVVMGLAAALGPRRPSLRKRLPYESGMTPIGEATKRLPIKFYLTAVLFILFDIEVIFFLPWAVVFRELGVFGFVEMLVFVLILIIGFVYVWKRGAFEWG
jgi:NADH-quinone oxidoreductase subunit A